MSFRVRESRRGGMESCKKLEISRPALEMTLLSQLRDTTLARSLQPELASHSVAASRTGVTLVLVFWRPFV